MHSSKCKHELHKYEGRFVSSLQTQWELEDLVRDLSQLFVHNGSEVILAYVAHLRAQPQPRPRQVIYLDLRKEDCVKTREPNWIVVREDDNPERLPVPWQYPVDMNQQVMVVIRVSGVVKEGSKTVLAHATHTIDALME